jgi:hypothetical protein
VQGRVVIELSIPAGAPFIVGGDIHEYKVKGLFSHQTYGSTEPGSTRVETIRYKLASQRPDESLNQDGSMQEYAAYYGTACIIFSVYLLIKGFTAASRQRSEDHSTTLVPAYVYGILASILLTVGLGFFRPSLPWWGYRLIFPGTTMLFPAIIYFVGRRPPKPDLDRVDA